jgi:hypothetical protein
MLFKEGVNKDELAAGLTDYWYHSQVHRVTRAGGGWLGVGGWLNRLALWTPYSP